jgi:hypothetical protein
MNMKIYRRNSKSKIRKFSFRLGATGNIIVLERLLRKHGNCSDGKSEREAHAPGVLPSALHRKKF